MKTARDLAHELYASLGIKARAEREERGNWWCGGVPAPPGSVVDKTGHGRQCDTLTRAIEARDREHAAALAQARADALGEAAKVADEQERAWQGTGPLCADARAAEAGVIGMKLRALQSTPPASAPPTYPAWDCLGCGLGYSRRCARCRERDQSSRPFGYPEHAPPAVECDGSGWVARRRTPGTKLGMVFVEQEQCPGCPNCKSKERR